MKIITEKTSKILIGIGMLLLVFGIIVFILATHFSTKSEIDTSKYSEFGDYFGGVIGAIWSLAGVILFYVALEEQRNDIKISQKALSKQIEEFELQRTELEETREVFKEQSETFKIQRFENTFFQLINLYNVIVGNLHGTSGAEKIDKKNVLTNYAIKLSLEYDNYLKTFEQDEFGSFEITHEISPTSLQDVESLVSDTYLTFHFQTTKQLLSNYFRTVYHIFKFVHQSSLLRDEEKQFYATIIRAQLSSDELFLIFYNALQDGLGYPNFLFLIKKFDILQNFDFGLIDKFKFHHELYEKRLQEIHDIDL